MKEKLGKYINEFQDIFLMKKKIILKFIMLIILIIKKMSVLNL